MRPDVDRQSEPWGREQRRALALEVLAVKLREVVDGALEADASTDHRRAVVELLEGAVAPILELGPLDNRTERRRRERAARRRK